jgi:hypothetical protein
LRGHRRRIEEVHTVESDRRGEGPLAGYTGVAVHWGIRHHRRNERSDELRRNIINRSLMPWKASEDHQPTEGHFSVTLKVIMAIVFDKTSGDRTKTTDATEEDEEEEDDRPWTRAIPVR